MNTDIEVLVIDDGSSIHHDENKLKCFEHGFKYSVNSVTIGRVGTRILLAKDSKNKHLLFLDADMLPKSTSFLETYVKCLLSSEDAVFGGYAYESYEKSNALLRNKYGKKREEKKALLRNKKPYLNIFSGNMLIKKSVFLRTNILNKNKYGLDLLFAAQLEKLDIIPLHIDNETLHRGIESNAIFLNKTKQAVKTLHDLHQNNLVSEKTSQLIKAFLWLKKLYLLNAFKIVANIFIASTEKFLLKNKAPLFLLDFYKLYHFVKC